jgi:hypothetical protein
MEFARPFSILSWASLNIIDGYSDLHTFTGLMRLIRSTYSPSLVSSLQQPVGRLVSSMAGRII